MGTTYVTSKEDYAANYIPTPADLNRIESNIDYLREQNKTINGDNLFTGQTKMSNASGSFLTLDNPLATLGANVVIGEVDFNSNDSSSGGTGVGGSLIVISSDISGVNTEMIFKTRIAGATGLREVGRFTFGGNLELVGNSNPTPTPSTDTWTTSQTIPRGQYNVTIVIGLSGSAGIYQGVTPIMFNFTAGDVIGGAIFSDGSTTNVQISGDASVKWFKY